MENKIKELESRVQKLEDELVSIREFLTLPTAKTQNFSPDKNTGAFIAAAAELGAREKEVSILAIKSTLGWKDALFDEVLAALRAAGKISLIESSSMLSIKEMGQAFMGDNGELFTRLTLL